MCPPPLHTHHVLKRGLLSIQRLREVLVVLPDAEVVVPLDHAVQRLQLARHQLEKCGLQCICVGGR